MSDTETQEWWGAADSEADDASWKTGSEAKRRRIERYVEWLLTPPALREPNSKTKLADELGVHPQTLRNYDKDPVLQRMMMEGARTHARVHQIPDILDALYQQATDVQNPRSVSAAKTLLDHAERLLPEADTEGIDVRTLNREELANLAVQLLQAVQDD